MNASEGTGLIIKPSPVPPIASPLVLRAMQVANDLIGTLEQPAWSNHGPVVDAIMRGVHGNVDVKPANVKGDPWCARSAVYIYELGAQQIGMPDSPFKGLGDLASGAKMVRVATAAGAVRATPQIGYWGVIMHADGTSHVTTFWQPIGSTAFESREGNTHDVAHTDGYWAKSRPTAGIIWIDPLALGVRA